MIRFNRLVFTIRSAGLALSHVIPPAGRTIQCSREASCKISEISSVDPGKIVFAEMLASPTISGKQRGTNPVRLVGVLGFAGGELGVCASTDRVSIAFASPQP